jgi:DNA replication protein DnaC
MRAFVKSEGSCLVLAGSVGCGKTYAANAIIQDFHHPGLLVNIPELYVSWKDAAREPHAEKALLKKSTSTPLVVFDDLGNRTPTDAFADFLYVIINERWSKKLHTVITTNISSKEIRARFGDAIASRILCGKAIKFADGDRRLDLNAF